MTTQKAITVLRNTAWLGTEKDREKVEKAIETLSNTSEIPNSSDDLISRQAAIDTSLEFFVEFLGGALHENAQKELMARIQRLPSAQPERKKGKWIYKNDLKQFFCSECGFPSLTYDDRYIYSMDLPNYCEDCGADMRGEEA